jgi:hypothetical protein
MGCRLDDVADEGIDSLQRRHVHPLLLLGRAGLLVHLVVCVILAACFTLQSTHQFFEIKLKTRF